MAPEPLGIEHDLQDDPAGDAEIAALRQRLAFYEGFDLIIQENIARSGDLLRLAAERQAQADHAAAIARRDLERETRRHLELLVGLLAEVESLRDAVDAVTTRVAVAIAAGDEQEPTSIPAAGSSSGDRERAQAPVGAAESVGFPPSGVPESTMGNRASGAGGQARASALGSSTADEHLPEVVGSPASGDVDGVAVGVSQALVVHGISDVTLARSLVDHLRGQEAIGTVEPKEFVGGVLRLAIAGRRPVRREDESAWSGGEVEIAEEGSGMLVLRLPSAPTL